MSCKTRLYQHANEIKLNMVLNMVLVLEEFRRLQPDHESLTQEWSGITHKQRFRLVA